MRNIIENTTFVAYKGKLYTGRRNKDFGAANFAFGDAEYYSSSYADASTYGSSSTMINTDLSGNISYIAKQLGVSYGEVRSQFMENGDGIVSSAIITPKRLMVYGGNEFTDITTDPEFFKSRFNYALIELDCDRETAERITNFVIKHNHEPDVVMNKLISEKLGGVLRQYASLCRNCDAFKTEQNITPHSKLHRTLGMENTHIAVIDTSIIQEISVDQPILPNENIYLPNFGNNEKINALKEVFKLSSEMENKIWQKWNISKSPVIGEALQQQNAENNLEVSTNYKELESPIPKKQKMGISFK